MKLAKLEQIIEQASERMINQPENTDDFSIQWSLTLERKKLTYLPESINKLSKLTYLHLDENIFTSIPESIRALSSLKILSLNGNPLSDLSILQNLPNLESVIFLGVYLPRRYWTKLDEWKAEWLLDESNAGIRQRLVEQIGYNKICDRLNAITIDTWREYTLLKIDGIDKIYGEDKFDDEEPELISTEPMVLLKMTCPSTRHTHILRVPPEMERAEEAIFWINHGIHPDEFYVQT